MTNVIRFPAVYNDPLSVDVKASDTGQKYLSVIKKYLTTEDYEYILLSIMDEEYYDEAEQELKTIVDVYFKYDN